MMGSRGTGKSLTLSVLAHSIRRSGGDVCGLDLTGKSADDVAWDLAAALRLGLSIETSVNVVWRRIDEHLDGRREARLPVTLLCDHFGGGDRSAQQAIDRLLRAEESGRTLSIVLAGRTGELSSSCLDLADVRVQLEPLDLRETHGYVSSLLDAAGAQKPLFDHESLDELHDLAGGIPREINRIAELALLAGHAEGAVQITESLVRGAATEARIERVRRRPARELVTN
jgi:type II secretory pathway predicted ATPase ExeA